MTPLAFFDGHDLTRCNSGESFQLAIEPANRRSAVVRVAESEVQAEIILRDERAATAHFIDLLAPVRSYSDARADRVASRSNGSHQAVSSRCVRQIS